MNLVYLNFQLIASSLNMTTYMKLYKKNAKLDDLHEIIRTKRCKT